MPTRPPQHQPPGANATAAGPRRAGPSRRGYDRRWQRLAQAFRRAHPLCADPFGLHEGRPTPGEHVDHIVPLAAGGTHDDSNLQTLCASCHSRKTVMQDGGFGRSKSGQRGIRGVDSG